MKVNIPKVKIPKRGLHDVFISYMADAMKVSEEEAKAIFNIK